MSLSERIIIAASQGRSGTKFLSNILALFPGVASFHEPEPNFFGDLRLFNHSVCDGAEFLLRVKLQAIQRFNSFPVYAETNHLWCQGPLDAWISFKIEPMPDVILLDRPLRDISLSLLRLGTIPGRTPSGLNWCLNPFENDNFLRWPRTKRWSDYQCCYAYCLEVEERKKSLAAAISALGKKVARTSAKELSTWRGIFHLGRQLNLHRPRLKQLYSFAFMKRQRVNTQQFAKTEPFVSNQTLDQEETFLHQTAERGNAKHYRERL